MFFEKRSGLLQDVFDIILVCETSNSKRFRKWGLDICVIIVAGRDEPRIQPKQKPTEYIVLTVVGYSESKYVTDDVCPLESPRDGRWGSRRNPHQL